MADVRVSSKTFHGIYISIICLLIIGILGVIYHYHKEASAMKMMTMQRPMMGPRGRMGGMMMGGMKGMTMVAATPQPLTAVQQQQITNGPSTATAQKTFDIDGGNFYFSPNKITVNKGDSVTINFKNDGGVHDFIIDAFKVKSDIISTDKIETFSFVASTKGTFQFYCSLPGHKGKGMVGTLIVQ